MLSTPTITWGQTPNPKYVNGSFTSTLNTESTYTVSLRQFTVDRVVKPAQFLYKFTVSDTCRVAFYHSGIEGRFKDQADSKYEYSSAAGARTFKYVKLEKDVEYSFDVNAEYMIFYRNGAVATIAYKGYVEYE